MPTSEQNPPFRTKLLFWIILGIFSTSFAEVLAGSMPFPLFNSTGWLITIPLYTLHIVTLAALTVRLKPNFYVLYAFGILFGLYEAYITKVLWAPPWDALITFNGVAVLETLVLILWWHPVLSFVIPVLLTEHFFTNSTKLFSTLPGNLKQLFERKFDTLFYSFAVLYGIAHVVGQNSLTGLMSGATFILSLYLITIIWRRTVGAQYSFASLMPNRNQIMVLFILLGMFYLLTGLGLRAEHLPGLVPQTIILVIYLFVFYLIFRLVNRQDDETQSPGTAQLKLNRSHTIWAITIFLTLSVVAPLLGPELSIIASTVISWPVAIILGLYLLTMTVKHAGQRH